MFGSMQNDLSFEQKKRDTLNGKEFQPAYTITHKTQVSSTPFAFILMGKYIIQ